MSLLTAALLMVLAGFPPAAPAPESEPQAETFQWVGVDGQPIWTAKIGTGTEQPAEPIRAESWYHSLDSLTLNVIDGDPVATDDLRGDVVVLDFWAGWCEPCREELPAMQAFHELNRDRGLHTFAVNVDEPRATALAAARNLGLELPVVEYTPELRAEFAVTQLPTVVLVDRAGRIRGRWEFFKDGTEDEIFWAIGEMLDLREAEAELIAERLSGGDKRLHVRWMRQFQRAVEGVASVAPGGTAARVLLTHGRTLLVLKPDGETETKIVGGLAGRLVPSKCDAEGRYSLLSYRLGATGVSRFDFPAGSTATWEAPAPVFDVQWIDPADPSSGAVLGTLDGMTRVEDGGQPVASAGIGLVRGLVRYRTSTGGRGEPAWLALTGGAEPRRWLTLADDLSTLASGEAKLKPWRVQGAVNGGFGLLPPSVKAVAAGRFFAGIEQDQLAVAGAGHLVILKTDSGAPLYRARWDGIGDLAAGDLDGDGLDELIVAWGQRVAVLGESLHRVDTEN